LIIGFQNAISGDAKAVAMDLAMKSVGGKILKPHDFIGAATVSIGEGLSVEEAITKLSDLPGVRYAEHDYIRYASLAPNDPLLPTDLYAMNTQGRPVVLQVPTSVRSQHGIFQPEAPTLSSRISTPAWITLTRI
jgi:hypothetical protein